MPVPVWSLLTAAVLLQGGPGSSQRSWIADLKARREALGTSEVRLEGDVVDIRSTSPISRSGFYRIIDASDPEGLLIRSGRLPRDGGALKVRARKAPLQPSEGMLLLDEIEQTRLNQRPLLPIVLVTLSLASFLVLVVLLIRAAVAERRYKLAPPLWLLPEAGPYGKTLALPSGEAGGEGPLPLEYLPELEEADQEQREQLHKRKRNLFHAVLGSFGFGAASAAWVLVTQPAIAQVPAFIFIAAEDSPVPIAQPGPTDTALVQATLDSLLREMAMNPPSPPLSAAAPAGPRRDSAPRGTTPVENPFQTPSRAPVIAAPAAESLKPPITSVPVAPSAPPPAPEPPPRDPEVERAMAAEALGQALRGLVNAINRKQAVDLARLMPETLAGSDLSRRERFMKLVREYSPQATLGAVEGTTLARDRGEARFSVEFSWRGDFGVTSRKTGQFLGLLRRDPSGWRFEGAQLLTAVP